MNIGAATGTAPLAAASIGCIGPSSLLPSEIGLPAHLDDRARDYVGAMRSGQHTLAELHISN